MNACNLIKLIGTAVAEPRRGQRDMYDEYIFLLFLFVLHKCFCGVDCGSPIQFNSLAVHALW